MHRGPLTETENSKTYSPVLKNFTPPHFSFNWLVEFYSGCASLTNPYI